MKCSATFLIKRICELTKSVIQGNPDHAQQVQREYRINEVWSIKISQRESR